MARARLQPSVLWPRSSHQIFFPPDQYGDNIQPDAHNVAISLPLKPLLKALETKLSEAQLEAEADKAYEDILKRKASLGDNIASSVKMKRGRHGLNLV